MPFRLFSPWTGKEKPPAGPFGRFFSRFRPDTVPMAAATPEEIARCEAHLGAPLPAPLGSLLACQNGGYYHGGLLHLFGAGRPLRADSLERWNHPELWKSAYRDLDLASYLFFAGDIFGNQFGCPLGEADPAVCRFDIQQGEFQAVADSIGAFFDEVLVEEGPWLLGSDFVDAYREAAEPWEAGQHLAMVTPGLLGGSMDPDNLRPMPPRVHLHMVGQIVTQIKPLPPGTGVRGFRWDPEAETLMVELQRR